MFKNIALINGVLLAIMVFFNGMVTKEIGPYMSTLIFHTIGLVTIVLIAIIRKNKFPKLKGMKLLFLLPGVLGVITIFLNNLCIPVIGVTLTSSISLYGQLVMSIIVEHFGLFGMPVNKFRKEKILGFSIISLGAIVMIVI
ncbi:DMT family transporter [Clostridium sp. YIM B02505]|uniref:DMT family transporter n=1 Tax=Clostridium yunnanense TaxID=2800325 RepID=A0ABS1EVK7_9CLOT|nr:DMT family transporter [Clostridium yunnanense]MBK1813333.1 DMT family transporter [Clostridium yunnanense]